MNEDCSIHSFKISLDKMEIEFDKEFLFFLIKEPKTNEKLAFKMSYNTKYIYLVF